jgi:hypothetical protein
MLVVHSEKDYRLPISEGLAMFNVLQAKGIPSKLVMFPDENHVRLRPTITLQTLQWQYFYFFPSMNDTDVCLLVGTEAGKFACLASGSSGVY